MTISLNPEQRWSCPNCDLTDVTHWPADHVASRMHDCRGLRGISAPMVPAGTRCKVETNEREDWVGRELVRVDGENRPIMNTTITRDDGTDVAVYAPSIQVGVSTHG